MKGDGRGGLTFKTILEVVREGAHKTVREATHVRFIENGLK